MKPITRDFLEKRRAVIIADLLSKVEAEDWHVVADAAMDLREIDAQLPLVQEFVSAGERGWLQG
jgi:hypothetical protein